MNKSVGYLLLVIVLCLGAMFFGREYPSHFFDEYSLMTYFNALQILIAGFFSLRIFKNSQTKSRLFWLIITLVAIYFSADELFQFHEESGRIIGLLKSLGFEIPRSVEIFGKSLITIGDLIQSLYAIFLIGVCWIYRIELQKNKDILIWLKVGVFFLILSEMIDFLGIHTDEKYQFLNLSEYQKSLWAGIEESLKTIGFGGILLWIVNRFRFLIKNG